jgi:hypothetical protein
MNKTQLTIYDTMDRRIKHKVRNINVGIRNRNTIVNRGNGYLYIVENSEMKGWFKVGMVESKENFTKRLNTYKHSMPVGEWNVLYLQPKEDIAIEELRMKHYCRYKLGYPYSPHSKEWYNGNPMEAINIPITQTQYRDKNIEGSYYSKDEAKEYIRTLKNK